MQKEFNWSESALLRQLERIVCDEEERQLLKALVRLYLRMKDRFPDSCADLGNGRFGIEVSKKEIGQVMGRGERTVQRKLSQLAGVGGFVSYDYGLKTSRVHLFVVDLVGIFNAPLMEPASAVGETHEEERGDISLADRCRQLEARAGFPAPSQNVSPPERPRGRQPPETGETLRPARGDMRADGGRHQGETGETSGGSQGRHCASISPKSNSIPSSPELSYSNHSIETMESGRDGISKKFHWGRSLESQDFREPERMQALFETVLEAGLAKDCEFDRLSFFAFLIHIRRTKSIRNPFGLLTDFIQGKRDNYKRGWREKPSDEDRIDATKIIRQLDFPPPPAIDWEPEWDEGEEEDFADDPEPAWAEEAEQAEAAEEPQRPYSLDAAAQERLRVAYQALKNRTAQQLGHH